MLRSFIAVPCPDELKGPLIEIQNSIKDFGKLKLVERENIHLTLRFLGNVDNTMIDRIINELKFISETEKFEISLKGLGAFPNLNHIRVIWVGVSQGDETMKKIQKEIENKLSTLNFKIDNRFHSHFTIARVKSLREKEKMQKFIREKSSREFGNFCVKKIELMESKLSPRGPTYSILHKFNLK